MHRLALLAVFVFLAACASPPPSPSPSAAVSDGTFSLAIEVGNGPLRSADAIDLRAILTYLGPAVSITVTPPDSGLVAFDFEQVGGRLQMLAGSRLICSEPATLVRQTPVTVHSVKMAGWTGDDPNAAFYQQWIADPAVHLPAGQWRITALARLYDGPSCDKPAPNHELRTSLTIEVES
jgi:hypothetical protein